MTISWKQAVPVFFLGLLMGAAGGSWAHRIAARRFMAGGPPRPERMLENLSRELKLDGGQKDALKKVLDAQHERMLAFHKETSARFEEFRRSFESDVKKILTPEQQARFEALSARWQKRHGLPGAGACPVPPPPGTPPPPGERP